MFDIQKFKDDAKAWYRASAKQYLRLLKSKVGFKLKTTKDNKIQLLNGKDEVISETETCNVKYVGGAYQGVEIHDDWTEIWGANSYKIKRGEQKRVYIDLHKVYPDYHDEYGKNANWNFARINLQPATMNSKLLKGSVVATFDTYVEGGKLAIVVGAPELTPVGDQTDKYPDEFTFWLYWDIRVKKP